VVAGWVDGGGSVVGVEIRVDGEARVGEYIRDAGAPIVAGRWGLGWTASRRGFETTDGGMTWQKDVDLPDPLPAAQSVPVRACGPIGCIAEGWLRVGWGTTDLAKPSPVTPLRAARSLPPPLDLDCQPVLGAPAERKRLAAGSSSSTQRAPPALAVRQWSSFLAGTGVNGASDGASSELPPFAGRPAPNVPPADLGIGVESLTGVERSLRAVSLAHVYAWGPKNGDWDQRGHWEARWLWPWGSGADGRSSGAVLAPWKTMEAAKRALGLGSATTWLFAPGDDPDHALLLARHTVPATSTDAIVLESDRSPILVRRQDGNAFPEVEAAVRTNGYWYLSTAQLPGELSATVLWLVDGSIAREVARVPRAGFETRIPSRLASREDGRAVGLVVDGRPEEGGGTAMRWVVGIDLETGAVGEPERLAPADFSDRTVSLCTGDDTGWELDAPYSADVRIHIGPAWETTLKSALARMRVTRDRACVKMAFGSVDAYGASAAEALWMPRRSAVPSANYRTIDVSVLSAKTRYALRCGKR